MANQYLNSKGDFRKQTFRRCEQCRLDYRITEKTCHNTRFCSRGCYNENRFRPIAPSAPVLDSLTEKDATRFWGKVQKRQPDQCWGFLGHRGARGYGHFTVKRGHKGRTMLAHRVAYFLHYGVDPGKLLVCHSCDNPPCCNPAHLFKGTLLDNMRDMAIKGRSIKGRKKPKEKILHGEKCPNSKLTNIAVMAILRRLSQGERQCELALEYDVARQHIWLISSGRLWKHLPRN